MAEWYKPSDIRFRPEHVAWALEHLQDLEEGYWPPDPHDSGYTDVHGPKRNHNAYFEQAVLLSAEINTRLAMCGTEGKLAKQCLAEGWDMQTLADLMHVDVYRIDTRVRRVVRYCSGWRRRRMVYSEFSRRSGIRDNYKKVKCA
tara:strand:+ start:108 stop:539 length:432 start_codon:yes stop_codon:yes gene_type:complete